MTDKIQKFLQSLSEKEREKLKQRIQKIKQDPFSGTDIKKMKGMKNDYRLRIGKVRIVYCVENGLVEIRDVDFRGNIY